jgi:ABC-type phosphate transport system substrate-binding protein
MKKYILILSILSILKGEVIVIANKDNPISKLTNSELSHLFLKKTVVFSNATPALVCYNKEISEQFNKKFLSKTKPQMNAYWSKMVFSNAIYPPLELGDDGKTIEAVAKNPNAISYIDDSHYKSGMNIKIVKIEP